MTTGLLMTPTVDDATRREFLALLGAAGMLSGCAAGDADDQAGGTTGATRTLTDVSGRDVVLPANPQRIALTSNRYVLDELLLLDAVPLAYAASESEELPVWTREELSRRGVTIANYNGNPYPAPPDFEQLASMAPDVIVVHDNNDTDELNLLRGIAPVVQVAYTDTEGSRLRMLAEMLGRAGRVAAIEAQSDALLETVTPLRGELAVVFGYRDGAPAAQVYNGAGRSELEVLERAGFVLADYDRPADERDFTLSEENFDQLDVDALWNVAPYPGDASARDFEASEILRNLAVMREGRYRSLDSDQSQAILFWTPLATPFLVDTLNELVASYGERR